MTSSSGQILSLPRLAFVLGVLSICLIAAITLQVSYLLDLSAEQNSLAKAGGELTLPQIPAYRRWPSDDGASQTDMQLFSLPPATAQAAKQVTEPQPTNAEASLKLIAVILAPGGQVALLESGTPANTIQVREGSIIGSWKLTSIGPNQVSMERGSERRLLYLSDTTAGTP